ncbi:hypothetical protein [Inquilinus sp.]|jgi:hypothetical protein|uniref:hypothetical protein n=1 Tax=Inquilinus sp. TaxID=1932117 RepID=UPI0037847B68
MPPAQGRNDRIDVLRGIGKDVVASFSLIALATAGIIGDSLGDAPARWLGSLPGRAIRWLGGHS